MIATLFVLAALETPDLISRAAPLAPLVLAQAEADVDHDGSPDTISITMVAGDITGGGCAGPSDDVHRWSGRFIVTVRLATGRSVSTYLNPLFGPERDLEFWAPPWTLFVADYRHDGQPGFSLAETSCHNNADYHLFTVRPDGVVEALCIAGSYSVFVFDYEASTADIKLNAGGFSTGLYDNSRGVGCESFWGWNPVREQFDLIDQKCGTPP